MGKKKVAILGGGIAGLTAAHELLERGYDVTIYEARSEAGGKAHTGKVPGWEAQHATQRDQAPASPKLPPKGAKKAAERSKTAEGSKTSPSRKGAALLAELPAEHGFHYFPAFYRHITDTLERIPLGTGAVYPRRTVADNLMPGRRTLIARESPAEELSFVRRLGSTQELLSLAKSFASLGLEPGEVRLVLLKLFELWSASPKDWDEKYERISWWEFIEAQGKSDAYRTYFAEIGVRATVAMDPRAASARTIGRILLRILSDLLLSAKDGAVPADRFMNGPFYESFLGPWLEHLHALGGANFELRCEQEVLEIECQDERVDKLTFSGKVKSLSVDEHFDYVISTLPVRPLITVVENSTSLRVSDPSLRRLKELYRHNERMRGLMLYLDCDVPLSPGGIFLKDSPWAITLVSQSQFWGKPAYPHQSTRSVATVLSVIISNWETPGDFHGISALGCSPQELRDEVWSELKAHFNDNPPFPGAESRIMLEDSQLVDFHIYGWDEEHNSWSRGDELFMHAPNTLKYRPDAKTKLKNFFLAGDFVKTTTDLATMEAANEAARLAVNALLDQDASREKRCGHWPMVPAPAEATSSLARAVAETATDTGRSVARATGDAVTRLIGGFLTRRR